MGLAAALAVLAVLPAGAFGAPQPFEGAIHEHTAYSDGQPGTRPADAFAAVRQRGSSFMVSTEHSDTFHLPIVTNPDCIGPALPQCVSSDQEEPANSLRKWDAIREQTDAATDGSFVGVRGFEWTNDRHGHINVLFSTNNTNAKIDGGYASMDTFWDWLTRPVASGGGADALATFNHPGRRELGELVPGGFISPFTPDEEVDGSDWDAFRYVPAADHQMAGMELFNGGSDYGDADAVHPAGSYGEALDKGWHVGAVGAEDTHDDTWGAPERRKTVLLSESLERAALKEAFAARRFYAIRQQGLRIGFTADGQPMGSRLQKAAGAPIDFTAGGVAPDSQLELVTSGGAVVARGTGTLSTTRPASPEERWYFLRVRDPQGQSIAYSSPVWSELNPG
jgi:hypothetical protein